VKNEKGQSLVEVIIALGVAVLVILALVRVTIIAIRNARFAKNQALATRYARQAIETIRAYRDENDWNTFAIQCEGGTIPLEIPSPPFDMNWVCPGDNDRREVTVTVFWTDGGKTHQSELITHFTSWK